METEGDLSSLIPIGSYSWKTGSKNSWCSKPEGFTTDLTFSQCFPNKYTCDSGYCIPLHQRCNTELNCEDKSDENNCKYMIFGQDYSNRQLPIDESGEPCIVYINASVLAFPKIDTLNLKFTADFYLNLRWYDLRLDFQDLNNVTSLNALSYEDNLSLWVPKLAFLNALGPFTTLVDKANIGFLVREGPRLKEKRSLSEEGKKSNVYEYLNFCNIIIFMIYNHLCTIYNFWAAMLFSGRDNSIYMTREYFQEYSCAFDLKYYPFDTQVIDIYEF